MVIIEGNNMNGYEQHLADFKVMLTAIPANKYTIVKIHPSTFHLVVLDLTNIVSSIQMASTRTRSVTSRQQYAAKTYQLIKAVQGSTSKAPSRQKSIWQGVNQAQTRQAQR